jgi:hypothetical protein
MTAYNKLYVVVRTDLSPEAQAIQATHAAIEWAKKCGGRYVHPTLVVLGVKNKFQLQLLKIKLVLASKDYFEFHEPDYNRGLTAIAIHHYGHSSDEKHHSILRGYKLWKLQK